MSNCPAYLGVTVADLGQGHDLGRYDLVITCPVTFNFTLSVSNVNMTGNDTTIGLYLKDDVKTTYRGNVNG